MLDDKINNLLSFPLKIIGIKLNKIGISPNSLTVSGFILTTISFVLIIYSYFYLALFFFIGSRILDGLDGTVARIIGKTKFGGYIDIVLDFIGYALIPFGFIINSSENTIAGCILIVSFFGTGSSFLAFAIYENQEKYHKSRKSFFYSNGLIEGFETIVFFILMIVFNDYFIFLAYLFSLLCIITTLQRIVRAFYTLD